MLSRLRNTISTNSQENQERIKVQSRKVSNLTCIEFPYGGPCLMTSQISGRIDLYNFAEIESTED